jgi:hypothetical protein
VSKARSLARASWRSVAPLVSRRSFSRFARRLANASLVMSIVSALSIAASAPFAVRDRAS